jgi:hypothetical protein
VRSVEARLKETRISAIILIIALAGVAACSRQPAVGAVTAGRPAPAAAPAQSGPQTITGAVVETMDASNYTYVRVRAASGDVWAATGRFNVAVGDRVSVILETPMENFHSQSLNRDFPLIYFTSRILREGESAAPPLAAAHTAMDGATPAESAHRVVEPTAPAAGGMTIAELWAKRAALAGRTVTVRGKVVKFNGGILGRNWLHIQDGTGSARDGSNDVTVTTAAAAKVGDVVTATGTVALDKDFGAGYAYKVIIESAAVVPK